MTDPAYRGQWTKVRLVVLERDGYRCTIREQGCTGQATEVDHVIPVLLGGARLDPHNLRAACRHCNAARAGLTQRLLAQNALNPATGTQAPRSGAWG